MVSRTEIAVMSDERKVSIGRITSKRSRGSERERERERGGKAERPDDGLITLHGRDTSSIEENFYEFQIHFPNVQRRRLPPVSRGYTSGIRTKRGGRRRKEKKERKKERAQWKNLC